MHYRITARPTLSAVEFDHDEVVSFTLVDGSTREIVLVDTSARIMFTTLAEPRVEVGGAKTFLEFTATLRIDGELHTLRRELPTNASFYPPWEIAGMRLWLDAVDRLFDHLIETHGVCRPRKAARLALQDATLRICPEIVHPWCPLRRRGLQISDCYTGEDCWLGPYFGASAHGGLDINHPPGTPIWAPIDIDDHGFFAHVDDGANNNRWRGFHRWEDGSLWTLQCHHMTGLCVPEGEPIRKGVRYADGAGVLSGTHDHSHFVFRVRPPDAEEDIMLDPWILFQQMYADQAHWPAEAFFETGVPSRPRGSTG